MDKMKDVNEGSKQYEVGRERGNAFCVLPTSYFLLFLFLLSGCATTPKSSVSPTDQKLQAVAIDLQKNPESRQAAEKILGVNQQAPVVKYSPVTGKHYSGDLEFDPETGAKLEVVKE